MTARKFTDLGISRDELAQPRRVDVAPRTLSAPEWEADPLKEVLEREATDPASRDAVQRDAS